MNIVPDLALTLLQVIPFLVTLVALHFIIFKPMLAYLDARKAAISGVREEARQVMARVEQEQDEWNRRLADARDEMAAYRMRLHNGVTRRRNELLQEARRDAEKTVGEALAEIIQAQDSARKQLQEVARSLGVHIAARLLGRPDLQPDEVGT